MFGHLFTRNLGLGRFSRAQDIRGQKKTYKEQAQSRKGTTVDWLRRLIDDYSICSC